MQSPWQSMNLPSLDCFYLAVAVVEYTVYNRALGQEQAMDKGKWMVLIEHLWETVAFWQLATWHRASNPQGTFFMFTRTATEEKVLMLIDHTVHLCGEFEKACDVGVKAK